MIPCLRTRRPRLLATLAWGAMILSPLAFGDDTPAGESLAAGLARVDADLSAGRWPSAHRRLLELVASRPHDPDLPLVLDGLRRRLSICAFREAYRPPAPAQLVRGELREWDERTGHLSLRYRSATLRHAGEQPAPASAPEALRTPAGDLVAQGDALIHPARFDGPYSIEIRGQHVDSVRDLPPAWRPRSAAVLALIDEGRRLDVLAGFPGGGHGRMVPVGHGDDYADRRPLDDKARDRLDLPVGGPYRFRVTVDRTTISATLDGRAYLRAGKDPKVFGSVGLLGFPHVTEVVIEGDTDGQWIADLIADDERRARELFDASYDPDSELPAWLVGPRRP